MKVSNISSLFLASLLAGATWAAPSMDRTLMSLDENHPVVLVTDALLNELGMECQYADPFGPEEEKGVQDILDDFQVSSECSLLTDFGATVSVNTTQTVDDDSCASVSIYLDEERVSLIPSFCPHERDMDTVTGMVDDLLRNDNDLDEDSDDDNDSRRRLRGRRLSKEGNACTVPGFKCGKGGSCRERVSKNMSNWGVEIWYYSLKGICYKKGGKCLPKNHAGEGSECCSGRSLRVFAQGTLVNSWKDVCL